MLSLWTGSLIFWSHIFRKGHRQLTAPLPGPGGRPHLACGVPGTRLTRLPAQSAVGPRAPAPRGLTQPPPPAPRAPSRGEPGRRGVVTYGFPGSRQGRGHGCRRHLQHRRHVCKRPAKSGGGREEFRRGAGLQARGVAYVAGGVASVAALL